MMHFCNLVAVMEQASATPLFHHEAPFPSLGPEQLVGAAGSLEGDFRDRLRTPKFG